MSNVSEGISALRQLSKAAKNVVVKRLAALDAKLAEVSNLDQAAKQYEERASKAKADAKRAETKLTTLQNAIDKGNDQLAQAQEAIVVATAKAGKIERNAVHAAKQKAADVAAKAQADLKEVESETVHARKALGDVKHRLEAANKELADTNAKIEAIKQQARAALK